MKPSPVPPRQAAAAPPALLAAALFALSFSSVLFTLALFKLLSFFIMPSLFFDLLFIGFPVGAFLGARFFATSLASFLRTLWILLGAAVFSIAACIACKHFDYLRAHLFEVEIPKLLGQIGAFTGLFIPYFAAYGLSEYAGYQYGLSRLKGRMRLVYALYLFGAAAAYLFLRVAVSFLGISVTLALSLGGMALAIALLGEGRGRRAAGALALGAALLAAAPVFRGTDHAIEGGFLRLYKGYSLWSSRDLTLRKAAEPVFRAWGRYSLCEILWSRTEASFLGLYNDFFQWEYAPGSGFLSRSLGAVPLWIAPRGGTVAIIGAGGGRQVRYAQRFGFEKIVAIEIEPAVVAAVQGPLAGRFDRVYDPRPDVKLVVGEARSYMERTGERFDLIYLPSVGGYPQMMLEPGNLIRTHEAYRTLRDRLRPGGVLAIWYPAGLDPKTVLTDQYVRTLRGLGMQAVAYEAIHRGLPDEYLILASPRGPEEEPGGLPRVLRERSPDGEGPETTPAGAGFERQLRRFFILPAGEAEATRGLAELPEVQPRELPVLEDPLFIPVTDEKPFLAGNIRHIFTTRQVHILFGTVAGAIALASAAVVLLLRRRGDPAIAGRSFARVALLSGLIGANFLLTEHFLVLALFRTIFVYHDALVLGAIGFLVLSGLGSIAITPRLRLPVQAAAAACLLVLLLFQLAIPRHLGVEAKLGPLGVLLLAAPAAFASGSFFPAVFELAARNPLGVFALDAVGAAFGSLLAFFVPIAFGFQAFFGLAAGVFLATALAHLRFHRGLSRDGALPSSPAS